MFEKKNKIEYNKYDNADFIEEKRFFEIKEVRLNMEKTMNEYSNLGTNNKPISLKPEENVLLEPGDVVWLRSAAKSCEVKIPWCGWDSAQKDTVFLVGSLLA